MVGPSGRKLCHWGYALKGMLGARPLPSLFASQTLWEALYTCAVKFGLTTGPKATVSQLWTQIFQSTR
jgi:hypothetical protein